MKKNVSILLAVLMLAVALTACGGGAHSSPEGVVQKLVDSINAGSMDGVISCLTPDIQDVFRAMLKLSGDSVSSDDLAGMMGLDSGIKATLRVNNVEIDGDTAIVNATIISDGNEETSDVPCVKVKGQWYIDAENGF